MVIGSGLSISVSPYEENLYEKINLENDLKFQA